VTTTPIQFTITNARFNIQQPISLAVNALKTQKIEANGQQLA